MDLINNKVDAHGNEYNWKPRRFVYAFELATQLSQVDVILQGYGRITHRIRSDLPLWRGWDAFASMKALSAKIAQEFTPVRFNTGHPTEPFQKLLLSDFDFIHHTPGPELECMASTHDDEDKDMDGDGDGDNEDDDDDDVEYLGERLRPDPEIDISPPRPPDDTDLSLHKDSERVYLRSRHYNGYRSCSAHFFCPFQPVPGSMLCFLHH